MQPSVYDILSHCRHTLNGFKMFLIISQAFTTHGQMHLQIIILQCGLYKNRTKMFM